MNGRKIDYLRISLTDRCNLRCRYCMPRDIESVPMEEILTYEEIWEIVQAATKCGIRHLRITGGEPLVRKGCPECIRMLKKLSGVETVMMTTNGILLKEFLPDLLEAGIDGINISLDTLQRDKYKEITGYDGLNRVLEALEACVEVGVRTKINVAAAKELNEGEIFQLAKLSSEYPVDVRFIEMMPIGYGKQFSGLDNRKLIKQFQKKYPGIQPAKSVHGAGFGPAVYWQIPGFQGRTGFISAMHGKFCKDCNRLRITSTGKLKYCLCFENAKDVKDILREEKNPVLRQEKLCMAFEEAIRKKPLEHRFETPEEISETKKMSQIGG